ncbi:MAG: hypothetical protein FNT29_08370 [Halothiobacillaceae bacterium]|nr:MAG: hypothetical protein FNT29_08370 [Halothiobacillaceae bacterium]
MSQEERTWLGGGQTYVVCAYYTDDYCDQVNALLASLKEYGLNHHLLRYDTRGFWEANTGIKPEFLLDCLARFPHHNIVYLDADAIVRSEPELFGRIEADIGICFPPADQGFSHRVLTGTLFLKQGNASRAFVQLWLDEQRRHALHNDQESFERALDRAPSVRFESLPISYVKIFDKGEEAPVIEHFQASRGKRKFQKIKKHVRNTALGLLLLTAMLYGIITLVGS